MNRQNKPVIALDVGAKRIGVAIADSGVAIARPLFSIDVDGRELERIAAVVADEKVEEIVVGYPRNQSGEHTHQTSVIESFKEKLAAITDVTITYQDESLTSVLAEEYLRSSGKPYTKGDIDVQAAMLILQDYLERRI